MKNSKSGFTLIEAVVYMAIASIVVLVITRIFISQTQVYDTETARADIELYAKTALNRITENSVDALSIQDTHAFSGTTFTSSSSTLVLQLPAIDASQNIINNKYDYLVFYLLPSDPTKLYMKADIDAASSRKASTTLLSTFVEGLNFRYNEVVPADATSVNISLNLAKVVRGTTQTTQSSTAIFLKNKF